MNKLPDFTRFLETITPAKLKKIQDDATIDIEELKNKHKDNFMAAFRDGIVSENLIITLGILSSYHEWLSEQLQKD